MAQAGLISLGPETPEAPQTAGKIDLTVAAPAPLSDKQLEEKTGRIDFGLGDQSPGKDVVYNNLATGGEDSLRNQVAAQRDIANNQQRVRILDEILGQKEIKVEDFDKVKRMVFDMPKTDPGTVLETSFADRFLNTVYDEPVQEDIAPIAKNVIARNEIINDTAEKLEAEHKNQSWAGFGADLAGQAVPLLFRYRIGGTEHTLTGDQLQEEIEKMLLLPPEEFKAQFSEKVNALKDENLAMARAYVDAFKRYGRSSRNIDNAFTVLDAVTVAQGITSGAKLLGKIAARRSAAELTEEAGALSARLGAVEQRQAAADAAKAATRPINDLEGQFADVGNIPKAAEAGAAEKVAKSGTETMEEAMRSMPSIFKVGDLVGDATSLVRERRDALVSFLSKGMEQADKILNVATRVTRGTADAYEAGVQKTVDDFFRDSDHLSNVVLDIHDNPIDINKANVRTVSIDLGSTNKTLFPERPLAEFMAEHVYGLPDGSWDIFQKGDGFGIRVTKQVDETSSEFRAANIQVETKAKPVGPIEDFIQLLKGGLSRFTSADNLLPEFQNQQRKAAEFGLKSTLSLMKEVVQDIPRLTKQQTKDLKGILEYNRAIGQTDNPHWFSVNQLEDAYLKKYGRIPSVKEMAAYYKYTQLNDLDWALRNFNLYREKAIRGFQEFSINFKSQSVDAGGVVKPQFKDVPWFDGKVVKDLPWKSHEGFSVLIYDSATHTPKTYLSSEVPADIRQAVKNGELRVVQVADTGNRPLKEVAGHNNPIEFLVSRDINNRPLRSMQLDYTPGGHVDYVHNWFVKQPRIYTGVGGKVYYEGDTTVLNFSSKAEAQRYAQAMEKARELLKDKKWGDLRGHLAKNLPWTLHEFKKLFGSEELLSTDHSFYAVQRGTNSAEAYKLGDKFQGRWKDYTKSEHNLGEEIGRQYVGARSGPLMTVKKDIGTDANPVFRFQPAAQVDPMVTIGRAVSNAANSRFFGDYQISAAEDFIKRYGDTMKVPQRELEANPMYYLNHPEWNKNNPKWLEAQATQQAIKNFTGIKTDLGYRMEALRQGLLNITYDRLGSDATDAVSAFLSNKKVDPVGMFKATAFHAKLGLFNPMQLPLQAVTLVQTIAISPVHGMAATISYFPVRWALAFPHTLEHAASIAEGVGLWKKADFIEAVNSMKDASWHNVGHEASWRNDVFDPVMWKGPADGVGTNALIGAKSFLDKGTFFFQEGERINRIVAWMTSYREWKAANPQRTLNQEARQQILNRADLLSNNMTRASQSSLQHGILAVPTQFWGYSMRQADLILGKRLTKGEWGRLMGVNAAVWGVPSSMAAATLYPWYDDVRQAALERGLDGNIYVKALTEGIPSLIAQKLGFDATNFSQRYGPNGISLLGEIARGEDSLGKILVGAAGSVTGDMLSSLSPLLEHTFEIWKDGGSYEPVLQDFMDFSKNISSVNAAANVYMAMNVQKYYSRGGRLLDDITTGQAVFKAMTGLDPLHISDDYLMARSYKAQKAAEDAVEKVFIKQYRAGMQEAAKGNYEAAQTHWKLARQALIAGDINPIRRGQFLSHALHGEEAMVDRVENSFWTRAPASQIQDRKNAFDQRQGNQ